MSACKRTTDRCDLDNCRTDTAQQIDQFNANYRTVLQRLSARTPQLGDLAMSFPAMLFALATGYGTALERKRTIAMINAGEPLKACAQTLGLPWWTRKLPAGAFTKRLGWVPGGGTYDNRFAQYIPNSPAIAAPWLARVCYAAEACDCHYALWVARQYRFKAPDASNERFIQLTAWAWYSSQTDTMGRKIMRRPWSSAMGLRRAVEEMRAWQRRIAMMARLGNGVADSWITEGSALGYDFVALRTIEDFIAESEAMDNCLDQYSDRLDDGVTRLFSIRKNGKSVADVEIGSHPEEPRMPSLIQLRGPRNRRASPQIWQAAFAWLGQAQLRLLPADRSRLYSNTKRRQARKQFWKPYIEHLAVTGHDEAFKLLVLGGARQRRERTKRIALRAQPSQALRDRTANAVTRA